MRPDGALLQELSLSRALEAGEQKLSLGFRVDNPVCWELDAPALYRYELTVEGLGQTESLSRKYGYREIAVDGPKITLNGRPVYARGVLHWGCYDDEIIPNPSREIIHDEIERSKAYGFNMIKHCLLYSERSLF